jgi:Response regulator containing CheY-like receiver domain and AraC-type DNA-binding domain
MSYKLIIADDEPLVLVGLKSLIDFKSLDIEIAGSARNGRELMELIHKEKPDIVISDIKMPVLSGLEVMKKTREEGMELPVFILLTSYEEFSLVKQALTLDAVDYLVKMELSEEVLENSLLKAIGIVSKKRKTVEGLSNSGMMTMFKDRFFVRLINNLMDSREQFERQKADLGLDFECASYLTAYMVFQGREKKDMDTASLAALYYSASQMLRETILKTVPCHLISLDMHHAVTIFFLDEERTRRYVAVLNSAFEAARKMVMNYFSVDVKVAVGKVVEDMFELSESFSSARAIAPLLNEDFPVRHFTEKDERKAEFSLEPYREELSAAFLEMDASSLTSVINKISAAFSLENTSLIAAIDASSNILYMALSLINDSEALIRQLFEDNGSDYRSIYKAKSLDECIRYLRLLSSGLASSLSVKKKDFRTKVVEKVQDYIKSNLDKKLSLSEVALLFGFSQNYLSSLFAKYGEMGFVEYTTKVKVDAAKEMLISGDCKVYEIADKLGFDNAFYFSKVFKKATGLSPREFLQSEEEKRMKI